MQFWDLTDIKEPRRLGWCMNINSKIKREDHSDHGMIYLPKNNINNNNNNNNSDNNNNSGRGDYKYTIKFLLFGGQGHRYFCGSFREYTLNLNSFDFSDINRDNIGKYFTINSSQWGSNRLTYDEPSKKKVEYKRYFGFSFVSHYNVKNNKTIITLIGGDNYENNNFSPKRDIFTFDCSESMISCKENVCSCHCDCQTNKWIFCKGVIVFYFLYVGFWCYWTAF